MPRSASIAPTRNVIFNLDDGAGQLGMEPLALRRAFFRGAITGTIVAPRKGALASNDQIRFTTSNLEDYITAGAPDSTPPKFTTGAAWIEDDSGEFVGVARQALTDACSSQLWSRAQATRHYDRNGQFDITVKLNINDELRRANVLCPKTARKFSNQCIMGTVVHPGRMEAAAGRNKTWLKIIAVSFMRRAAKQALASHFGISHDTIEARGDALQLLYSEAYPKLCASAFNAIRDENLLRFTHTDTAGSSFDKNTGEVRKQRGGLSSITYVLPFSAVNFSVEKLSDFAF